MPAKDSGSSGHFSCGQWRCWFVIGTVAVRVLTKAINHGSGIDKSNI
jgi:hypothetical protein